MKQKTRNKIFNLIINILPFSNILYIVIIVFGIIDSGDLMYGFALFVQGLILSISLFLAFIPYFNIYTMVNINDFLHGLIADWGFEWMLANDLIFILGMIPIVLFTVVIDLLVSYIIYLWFTDRKYQAQKIINEFMKT